jgi:soluble lytic murein transglycosylase-like protein
MGALRIWASAALLAIATPAHAQSVTQWHSHIVEASARFGVPAEWIERVMRAESGGRTTMNGRPIRSSAGAIGLMQLMPGTWREVRAELGLGHDPDDPRDNILAGTFYLRLMHNRFGYPGLFAAYNAGPGRYAEYLAGRRRLPSETVAYLAAVAPSDATNIVVSERVEAPRTVFVLRKDRVSESDITAPDPRGSLLFVTLSRVE